MPDVYIAEGHGSRPDGTFDPGATDGIHSEQRDSKPVAEACTRVLRNAGLDVVSESDMANDPNFYGTTAAANEAGVRCVISFHYDWNQAPPGAFAIWKTTEGRRLAEAIEARVGEAGFDIRGYSGNPRSLYLLNNSDAPAVIFECGRIGHEDIDETSEQRAMGEAAARGILDWLGIEQEGLVPAPITPQSDKEAIRVVQEATGIKATGNWDAATRKAVAALAKRSSTGDPKGLNGDRVNGRMFYQILEETVRKFRWSRAQIAAIAAASAAGGASASEVIQEIIRRLGG